ncbi:hypothetical protein DAT35_11485 [Vitiosangium sp. GDMCC 1.1324]|nr:hypothetical protein DAT35_11485 [Vitiosangium sp. GDMCC 1.1324]
MVGTAPDGAVLVDFPGNRVGPLPARASLSLDAETLARAAAQRQGAILLFENGDPSLPLLVGLLQVQSSTPLIDAVLERSLEDVPKVARVDGRQVVIEGRDEVVLRCGKATLTLRRDGQVVLRGVNIRTEADEVQRIKGSKVQIN